MSGLIWEKIGKGISDAGQTYGNAMFKQFELAHQDQRDASRDAASLKRQEALDELKAERDRTREEELQKRVIKESADVSTKASEIGAARETAQGEKDVKGLIGRQMQISGDSPAASEEEIKKLIEENPQYKEIYRKAGYIDREPTANQKRIQRADDEVQASLDIGAHSSVQKAMLEKRKAVLDEIRAKNKEENDKAERDLSNRRLDLLEERIASQARIGQQNAETNAKRVEAAIGRAGREKPDPQSTPSARLNSVTAAISDIRKSLESGEYDKQGEVMAREDLKVLQQSRTELAKQVASGNREKDPGPANPSDKKPAAAISALPKDAVPVGTSKGRTVYRTPDGKQFIAQ